MLEEEEVQGRWEKGKKYAVGFAICNCHLIIRGDKSRKVGQIEHEGNPKERNSCRDIATEETMFILFTCLWVTYRGCQVMRICIAANGKNIND